MHSPDGVRDSSCSTDAWQLTTVLCWRNPLFCEPLDKRERITISRSPFLFFWKRDVERQHAASVFSLELLTWSKPVIFNRRSSDYISHLASCHSGGRRTLLKLPSCVRFAFPCEEFKYVEYWHYVLSLSISTWLCDRLSGETGASSYGSVCVSGGTLVESRSKCQVVQKMQYYYVSPATTL